MKTNFMCPICGEYFFSEPLEDETMEDFQCTVCGWNYNEDELDHPDKLEKYKEQFKKQREIDPKWNYLEANAPDPIPHKCPICGKYEFSDDASYDICPFCGWEDDGVQNDDPTYAGGANDLCMNDYKKQYQELISKNPSYRWDKIKR